MEFLQTRPRQRWYTAELHLYNRCYASNRLLHKGYVKKWEKKANVHEKRYLLKIERHLRPAESSSSHRELLREILMRDVLHKKSLQIEKDRSSAQEAQVIRLYKQQLAFPPKETAKTKRSMAPNKMTSSSAKISYSGILLNQRSK